MIEQLLEAERALSVGLLDQAERLYRSVADHDPLNSIAVVGLARVALERGDDRLAYVESRRALAIDGDNQAAQRMVLRLEEVMRERGEKPPEVGAAEGAAAAQPAPPSHSKAAATAPTGPTETPGAPGTARRSLVDRLLGRRR
jgi:uncharacterized protein HemY